MAAMKKNGYELWATFEGYFFMGKNLISKLFLSNVAFALKGCLIQKWKKKKKKKICEEFFANFFVAVKNCFLGLAVSVIKV